MDLKSTNKVETNKYELEVSIDAAEFGAAIDQAYKKEGGKITVPGFRKGKAPRHLIEKMYGENFFYEEALNIAYPEAAEAAIAKSGLEVITVSGVDVAEISKDGVGLKITVVVKPEVKIDGYKGLKAEKIKVDVTDDEVEHELSHIRERNGRMVTVDDRAAAMDDTAEIDFEGFVDGEAFEGGKGENYSLKLGSGQFIPGFEEQIVGHNTGDEFDVNVTFPEDYHETKLAGKPAVFKVKLHEIKMTELPELDDEFAKDVSEFDTLDEYKADLKQKALAYKQKSADDAVENQLIDQLVDLLEGEIPDEMIDARVDDNVRDFAYRLQMQGLDINTYLKYTGGDMSALRDSMRDQADKQVKVRLALEKIAENEKIEVTEEDLDAEYAKYAESYKMEVDKVKAAIPADEIKKDLAVSKAIAFVRDNAEIKEVEQLSEKEADEKPAKKTAAKKSTAKKSTAKKAETDAE